MRNYNYKRNWTCHVQRSDKIMKLILEWKPNDNELLSRPKQWWINKVKKI